MAKPYWGVALHSITLRLLFLSYSSYYFVLSLLLSLLSPQMTNSISLFSSIIYSLRLVGCLRLTSGFTHVVGAQIDYSWEGIYFVGNCVNGVGTSSNLQKIARQRDSPRHYPATKESLPIVGISTNHSIYGQHSHAKLVTSEPIMVLGMGLSIFMGLSGPRPKTSGPMSVCRTLTKLQPPRHCRQWYILF